MTEHVHTGPIAVLFAGLSAILVIHLLRIVAAWLSTHGQQGVGKALGAFALAD